jgi:hypothetical protein
MKKGENLNWYREVRRFKRFCAKNNYHMWLQLFKRRQELIAEFNLNSKIYG